jgi:ribosomal protein S18 acetylase RimI-like enzyme
MDIAIREAKERDYAALCAIIDQVDRIHQNALPARFKNSGGPSRELEYVVNAIRSSEVGLFVAQKNGYLVGLVHVVIRTVHDIPILVPRRYAVVENLAVTEEHRRGGIGLALMERAEEWARAKGATSVELNVYAFNRVAQRFYRQLGYEILSHRMTKPL